MPISEPITEAKEWDPPDWRGCGPTRAHPCCEWHCHRPLLSLRGRRVHGCGRGNCKVCFTFLSYPAYKAQPFPWYFAGTIPGLFFFFLVLVSQNSALWGAKLPRGATLDLCWYTGCLWTLTNPNLWLLQPCHTGGLYWTNHHELHCRLGLDSCSTPFWMS